MQIQPEHSPFDSPYTFVETLCAKVGAGETVRSHESAFGKYPWGAAELSLVLQINSSLAPLILDPFDSFRTAYHKS